MLIACSSCHRQYDVGDLRPRSKVRCACGTLNEVPPRGRKRPGVAYCRNCGAPREGKGPCAYCDATPSVRAELGDPCPECFAHLGPKARFCSACGVAIQPSAVVRAVADRHCPRCRTGMIVAEGRGDPFHQCPGCGGIWLSLRAFQRFVERSAGRVVTGPEQRSTARGLRRSAVARRKKGRKAPPRRRSLHCPTCRVPMAEVDYATYSGITVDTCVLHGWWFEESELERIGAFLAGGGLEAASRRRRAHHRVQRHLHAWKLQRRYEAVQSGLGGLLFALLREG